MEPTIPTSFIPKRPVESTISTHSTSSSHSSRSVGILSLLATVAVIGTAVAFAGVVLYQKQLGTQKQKLESSIADARDGLGTDFVADMKRLDARIAGAKLLIKSHLVVTPLFTELQNYTLRSVQYKDFSYSYKPDDKVKNQMVTVTLSGTARSYATIALQSDAFSQSAMIKNPVFSNLTLDDKTRSVNFKLVFSVDPNDLSYEKFTQGLKKAQQPVPADTTPAAPTGEPANTPTP